MRLPDLIETVSKSVVRLVYKKLNGDVIGSGTGFWVNGYLVTNHHVHEASFGASSVCISDGGQSGLDISIRAYNYRKAVVASSEKNREDFVVLQIDPQQEQPLEGLELMDPERTRVGDNAIFFGFPFGSEQLVCHRAMISSRYRRGSLDILQLDASVNAANSGGPLVDIETGRVIGVITLKATGLSRAFDDLRKAMIGNIDFIEKSISSGASLTIAGFDPSKAALASQNQVLTLISQIEQSANVGIGYAYSSKHIIDAMDKFVD